MATAKKAPTRASAPALRAPFGKPAARADNGDFSFQLPENIGSGRGRIPKGKYVGRCTGITNDISKSSGNPMWTWVFVITVGPQAGRDFKLWTVLTDDAAWKIVETLKALGLEVEPGDEIKMSRKDVIGVGCTMHVKDDNGQDGDGEFSKLDKISAHPKGAGYRPGGGIAAKAREEEDTTPIDDVEEEEPALEEEEPWICAECEAEFVTEEELDEHIAEEHANQEEEETIEEEEEEEPAPPPRRPVAKKSAPPARPVAKKTAPARGKAPATLGRGRKK